VSLLHPRSKSVWVGRETAELLNLALERLFRFATNCLLMLETPTSRDRVRSRLELPLSIPQCKAETAVVHGSLQWDHLPRELLGKVLTTYSTQSQFWWRACHTR
jgi:hypothetical protein